MKKRLFALALLALLLTTVVTAAQPAKQAIEVTYGISLTLNGQKQTLTDVNGKEVFPFVYAGTTYVPIRAVSENLGGIVNYDQSTNTASIYFNAAAAADTSSVQRMGLYKILEEELGKIEDIFTNFMLDVGMFTESEQLCSTVYNGLQEGYDLVADHYSSCLSDNLLTAEDAALITEYDRLFNLVTSALQGIETDGRQVLINNIVGAATQNRADATIARLTAAAGFWQAYQSAF